MRIIFLFILVTASICVHAQTPSPSPTPADEPEFIVPARPTVANPAEFQQPGVLQLEVGYDGNFNARGDYKIQQDMPLSLRFAVNRRLLIELDTDSPYSMKDPSGVTKTGFGDTQLGIQAVLLPENKSRPGVAFAYYIKVPTADENKDLGTGRDDHSFIGLVSKTAGKTTIDFNAIYLLAGKTSSSGYASSGQGAFAVTQKLTKKFSLQGEISGMSRNDEQSGMMFGLAVASYQINRRTAIDGGIRFGLTPDAPKVGVVAGVTFGIGDLYKKHH
jgi:Putative MetA-pathway of phenol degradation